MLKNELIIEVIDNLAKACHNIAREKGFHSDDLAAKSALNSACIDGALMPETFDWYLSVVEQAEIARMHSELSEWLEGIRKGKTPDAHLPQFSSAEVEAADLLHRLLDTCAKRNYRLGEALVAKMIYNQSRPRKHGKNS